VFLPLTTKIASQEAFPLRVRVPKGTCGLERDSEVLVDQMQAWDNSLLHKELGMLPEALIEKVTAALRDFLDIRHRPASHFATLAKAVEPVMLLAMGVVVGLLVASLILPIFKLFRAVH
jgi:PemK-like, MazF-like toxin of type II toxin-antitoxin system